jgi:hypothetical protein
VYYELLNPNETITGDLYRTQLMRLSRALKEKRAHYASRYYTVILLHDNARPHVAAPVKTYLERLNWEVLPPRCIHQTLLLLTTTCFDRWRMACLSNTSHHMKIPKIGSIRRWLQKMKSSSDTESVCCQKDAKRSWLPRDNTSNKTLSTVLSKQMPNFL